MGSRLQAAQVNDHRVGARSNCYRLAIDLKIAWYDELSADLATLSETLAADSTVIAVIGPFSNEGVAEFAPACMKTQKPLIAPTATSEDVIRRDAVTTSGQKTNTTPFLWSLTETDVNFAGLLMSGFATESQYRDIQYKDFIDDIGAPMCGVFSPDDAYGMTFNYWAPKASRPTPTPAPASN